jgi:hypothetical protein
MHAPHLVWKGGDVGMPEAALAEGTLAQQVQAERLHDRVMSMSYE